MRIIHPHHRTDPVIDLDRDTHRSRLGYSIVSCLALAAASLIAAAFPYSFHDGDNALMLIKGFLFVMFSGIVIDCFMRSTKGSALKRVSIVVAICAASFLSSFLVYEADHVSDMFWESYGFTSFGLCLMLFQLHRSLNPAD